MFSQCERNSAHNVRRFPTSFSLCPTLPVTMWKAKAKICSALEFEFFSQNLTIFIVYSIQFFILSSKISKFLKLNQNWRFYTMFSHGTIFLEEGFLITYQECEENVRSFSSSFRLVPHNVSGISPSLWPTMWQECEENMSLNEDDYYLLNLNLPTILNWNRPK